MTKAAFDQMKASPWEKDDAIAEDIPILDFRTPKAFLHENGKLTGMAFRVPTSDVSVCPAVSSNWLSIRTLVTPHVQFGSVF